MATPQHTPHGRGYEHSLVYFHHVNDAWSFVSFSEKSCMGQDVLDLWENEGPAYGLNNSILDFGLISTISRIFLSGMPPRTRRGPCPS